MADNNENFSPLANVKVINRDITASTGFNPLEDDYPDDKEDEKQENNNPKPEPEPEPKKTKSPKEFKVDISEQEEVDNDFFLDTDYGTDNEREKAKILNRKIVAKNILDMIGYGIPFGVKSIAGLPTKEIDIMILEAQKVNNIPYQNIFEKALANDKKNFEKLNDTIRYFTVQMEEPLRQVMGNKSIDVSPEAQLTFLGVGLVGSVAYATYDIRSQNIEIMDQLRKAQQEMMDNVQPTQPTQPTEKAKE